MQHKALAGCTLHVTAVNVLARRLLGFVLRGCSDDPAEVLSQDPIDGIFRPKGNGLLRKCLIAVFDARVTKFASAWAPHCPRVPVKSGVDQYCFFSYSIFSCVRQLQCTVCSSSASACRRSSHVQHSLARRLTCHEQSAIEQRWRAPERDLRASSLQYKAPFCTCILLATASVQDRPTALCFPIASRLDMFWSQRINWACRAC